jgi:Tfp pilus assembly protein PilV
MKVKFFSLKCPDCRFDDPIGDVARRRGGGMPMIVTRKGLALVECLLALAILSGTVLAVSYTVVAGNQQSFYADRAAHAGRIAADFFEEISSKSFQDPDQTPSFGKESGETQRSQYDDVDDYINYTSAAGQLAYANGTLYGAEDQVFSLSIAVQSTTQSFLGKTLSGDLVTLTLTHTNGEQWAFTRFIPAP